METRTNEHWLAAAEEKAVAKLLAIEGETAFLTREDVLKYLRQEKWSVELACKVMAGLNPEFVPLHLPAHEDRYETASRAEKQIRKLVGEELKILGKPDISWVTVEFQREVDAVENGGDGDSIVDGARFPPRCFFRLAAKVFKWRGLDCPVFGLFHDRQAEAKNVAEKEWFWEVLEPAESWHLEEMYKHKIITEEEAKELWPNSELPKDGEDDYALPDEFKDECLIAGITDRAEAMARKVKNRYALIHAALLRPSDAGTKETGAVSQSVEEGDQEDRKEQQSDRKRPGRPNLKDDKRYPDIKSIVEDALKSAKIKNGASYKEEIQRLAKERGVPTEGGSGLDYWVKAVWGKTPAQVVNERLGNKK